MATRFKFVQNDTSPQLMLTLTDENDDPINLVGATVELQIREEGGDAVKAVRPCTLVPGRLTLAETIDTAAPFDVAGRGGRAYATWSADTWDTPGFYEAEVEVTYSDGSVETSFDTIKFEVREQIA